MSGGLGQAVAVSIAAAHQSNGRGRPLRLCPEPRPLDDSPPPSRRPGSTAGLWEMGKCRNRQREGQKQGEKEMLKRQYNMMGMC